MTKQTLITLTSGQELPISLSYPAKKLPKRSFPEGAMSKATNSKSWKNLRQATLSPRARCRGRTNSRKIFSSFALNQFRCSGALVGPVVLLQMQRRCGIWRLFVLRFWLQLLTDSHLRAQRRWRMVANYVWDGGAVVFGHSIASILFPAVSRQ